MNLLSLLFVTVTWNFSLYYLKSFGVSANPGLDVEPSSERYNEKLTTEKFFNPNQFPFIASLVFVKNITHGEICFGSILSSKWILTAAKCTVDKLYVEIGVGKVKLFDKTGVMNVSSEHFLRHENYVPYQNHYDIALIETEEISFSNAVQPIMLSKYDLHSYDNSNEEFHIFGWGLNNTESSGTPFQYRTLAIWNDTSECFDHGIDYKEFVCAYSPDNSSLPGVFVKTFGHPLTETLSSGRKILVGIYIMDVEKPTATRFIYTSTSFFVNWIANKMGF